MNDVDPGLYQVTPTACALTADPATLDALERRAAAWYELAAPATSPATSSATTSETAVREVTVQEVTVQQHPATDGTGDSGGADAGWVTPAR